MKRNSLTALILSSLLVCTFAPLATPAAQEPSRPQPQEPSKASKVEFVPGTVLVRFRLGTALASRGDSEGASLALRALGGRQIPAEVQEAEGLEIVEGLRVARVAPEDTLEAVEALRKRPDVLYAEPDYVRRKDAAPNDPRYPEL